MPGITGVYDGPKQKLNTYLLNTLLETRVHSGFVEESTQIPTFPENEDNGLNSFWGTLSLSLSLSLSLARSLALSLRLLSLLTV